MFMQQQTQNSWKKQRAKILNFISRYSDKRIAIATFNSLRLLSSEQLLDGDQDVAPATILTMVDQKHLVGIAYFNNNEPKQCLIVVHPLARKKGVGEQLFTSLISRYKDFRCYVAIDNISSLKLCFKSGLHAVSLSKGPTGKPTLCFERSQEHVTEANRNSNPILEREKSN